MSLEEANSAANSAYANLLMLARDQDEGLINLMDLVKEKRDIHPDVLDLLDRLVNQIRLYERISGRLCEEAATAHDRYIDFLNKLVPPKD